MECRPPIFPVRLWHAYTATGYNVSVIVRYRYRCYPHADQHRMLSRTFGCVRYVYNHFLRVRSDAYTLHGERVGYAETDKRLTALKKTDDAAFLNEVSSVPLQQALRHLQAAYVNFFEGRAKYPVFKRKTHKQSATFTKSGFSYRNGVLAVAKVGPLKVRWSRDIPADVTPSSVTITRSASGRYYVTLTLDMPDPKPLPATGQSVGVDLGISRLATLSTGEFIPNPKRTANNAKRLARLQRSLCRRRRPKGQRQSSRYMRLKKRIARLHERIADARNDTLDKLTTRLVRENDRIGIEDLNVRGMVKNHALARSISDAALGTFRRMIEYKAARAGRTVLVAPPFFPSSQLCSGCGHRNQDLKLGDRRWTCPGCGISHDRDANAAKNLVQAAGHAVSARGGSGKTSGASAPKGTAQRTANRPTRKSRGIPRL